MDSLFKFLLARGIEPFMCSLFSKCTSRVVVFRSWDRLLAIEAGDSEARFTGLALVRQRRASPPMLRGRPARESGICCGPLAATIPNCQCGVINAHTLND